MSFCFPRRRSLVCLSVIALSSSTGARAQGDVVLALEGSPSHVQQEQLVARTGTVSVPLGQSPRFAGQCLIVNEWNARLRSEPGSLVKDGERVFEDWTLRLFVLLDPSRSSKQADGSNLTICSIESASVDNGSSLDVGFVGLTPFVEFRSSPESELIRLVGRNEVERDQWAPVAVSYDGRRLRLFAGGYEAANERLTRQALCLNTSSVLSLFDAVAEDGRRHLAGCFHSLEIYDEGLSERELKALDGAQRELPEDNLRRAIRDGYFLAPRDPLQARIDYAIDRAVENVSGLQTTDGDFPPDQTGDYGYRNGWTALCGLALLHSGVPAEDPRILKALEFLREQPPEHTYSASVQLLLLLELHNSEYDEWAREVADLLLSFEHRKRGQWGYPDFRADLSNTQFAFLALFAAHEHGIEIDSRIWKRTALTILERYRPRAEEVEVLDERGRTREVDIRGFSYRERLQATPSMTAAGICVLDIARRLDESLTDRRYELSEGIDLALAWLRHRYHSAVDHYTLYSIERIGALLGFRTIGEQDWYREGAERLVKEQQDSGAFGYHLQNTCFSLLFLNRSTEQVTGRESPVTGASRNGVFELKEGPVHIRAAGRERSVIYVTELSDPIADRGEFAPYRARWYLNGDLLQVVGSEPGERVLDSSFAIRRSFAPGRYQLRVEIDGLTAAGKPASLRSHELAVVF
ncbi:MAG: hypothetical protein AAF196_20830 [Planctomycetota bacterium]